MPAALLLLLAASCRQATPAEVGAQSIRNAMPQATSMAAARAYAVSPQTMAPAAHGTPVRQPPQP